MSHPLLDQLPSPILLQGNDHLAFRDPAAIYFGNRFHLFFTLVETESPGQWPYLYTAISTSTDLLHWTHPCKLTPRDRSLNYSSPGSIIRFQDQWCLCLQSYPRPHGEKYANESARLFLLRSSDLQHWSDPELLHVKGPDVPPSAMGRMIDPFLLQDKDDPAKWWCLFKQNGMSFSWSCDLQTWHFAGHHPAGENVCILREAQQYILFDSPENGIGMRFSPDLHNWGPRTLLTLGQACWPWAQGRLTAAFVLDARHVPGVGKFLMFFHGTGPENEQILFDTHACIGIAWSDDLVNWQWPPTKS